MVLYYDNLDGTYRKEQNKGQINVKNKVRKNCKKIKNSLDNNEVLKCKE